MAKAMTDTPAPRKFRALKTIMFSKHPDPALENSVQQAGWVGEVPGSEVDIRTLVDMGVIEEVSE